MSFQNVQTCRCGFNPSTLPDWKSQIKNNLKSNRSFTPTRFDKSEKKSKSQVDPDYFPNTSDEEILKSNKNKQEKLKIRSI